jgi:hypothetical protein
VSGYSFLPMWTPEQLGLIALGLVFAVVLGCTIFLPPGDDDG